jgi:DNA-directed RNA polymerase subunit RPC12/RpoP
MKYTKENKKSVRGVGLLVHTEENKKPVRGVGLLVDPELILICRHCGKQIDQSLLIGLSLKCPSCGIPQNGHPQDPTLDPYDDMTVICKHCGKPINQARLRGISLICPLCGMPQNGQPHPKS